MFDETVNVLENKKVNTDYYKLIFSSKRLSQKVLPGQFINLQVDDSSDPLLRRPFSYYRVRGTKIEVLYEILGRGTELLSKKRAGHKLRALGPLGLGFTRNLKGKKRVLVGGGVGVPPLVMLAEAVGNTGTRSTASLYFFIGCKTKGEVLPRKELAKIKGKIQYATNDGSYGVKGFVTVPLRDLLNCKDPKSLFIQTCGPHAMMQAVVRIAREYGVAGEASIDERMACGVGACLGCVVETTDGFKTSCVEGPVFQFKDLVGYA
jgi:dihydroorotate dehydrogenase electron transfer subunit